jgi:hypothetical protein
MAPAQLIEIAHKHEYTYEEKATAIAAVYKTIGRSASVMFRLQSQKSLFIVHRSLKLTSNDLIRVRITG